MDWSIAAAIALGIILTLAIFWAVRAMGIWPAAAAQTATDAGNTGTGAGTETGTGTGGTPPTGNNTTTGGNTNVVITDPPTGGTPPTAGTPEMQLIGLIRDGNARGLKADIVFDPATGYRRTSVEIDPWKEVKADVDALAKSGDVELTSASGAKLNVRQRPITPAELEAAGRRVLQDLVGRNTPPPA